jgi:hypothetical protein
MFGNLGLELFCLWVRDLHFSLALFQVRAGWFGLVAKPFVLETERCQLLNQIYLVALYLDIHASQFVEFNYELLYDIHSIAEFLAVKMVIFVFVRFELRVTLLQYCNLVLQLSEVDLTMPHLVYFVLQLSY